MRHYNNNVSFEEADARYRYDPETGFIHSKKTGRRLGCRTPDGYIAITHKRRYIRAHRLAWLLATGDWPEEIIDHINGVRDDNRLCNLRPATMKQNLMNRPMHSRNQLGVKGVIKTKHGSYRAQLWHDGKFRLNKSFPTLEAASAAYQAKAKECFGEWYRGD